MVNNHCSSIMNDLINFLNVKTYSNLNSEKYINNVLLNVSRLILSEIKNLLELDITNLENKVYSIIENAILTSNPKNIVYLAFDGCLSKQDLLNLKQECLTLAKNRLTFDRLIDLLYNKNLNEILINRIKNKFSKNYQFKLIVSDKDYWSSADQKIVHYIKRNYNNLQVNVVYYVDIYYHFVLEKNTFIYLDETKTFLNLKDFQTQIYRFISSKVEQLDISKKNILIDLLYIIILAKKLPINFPFNVEIKDFLKYYIVYLMKYCQYIISFDVNYTKLDLTVNYTNLSRFLKIVKNKSHENLTLYYIPQNILCEIKKNERFPQHKNYNYMKSILWYFQTYVNNQPSNTWCYMYYINPTLSDIIKYIDNHIYDISTMYYYSEQASFERQLEFLKYYNNYVYLWNGKAIIQF